MPFVDLAMPAWKCAEFRLTGPRRPDVSFSWASSTAIRQEAVNSRMRAQALSPGCCRRSMTADRLTWREVDELAGLGRPDDPTFASAPASPARWSTTPSSALARQPRWLGAGGRGDWTGAMGDGAGRRGNCGNVLAPSSTPFLRAVSLIFILFVLCSFSVFLFLGWIELPTNRWHGRSPTVGARAPIGPGPGAATAGLWRLHAPQVALQTDRTQATAPISKHASLDTSNQAGTVFVHGHGNLLLSLEPQRAVPKMEK